MKHILPYILLVDDEPDILVALEDLLEDNFRVLSTTDPAEALELLNNNRDISVIVSDQRMPFMTGDQFLTKARALTTAPAILLTGYADMNAVIAALNQGRIMFYSHKPWESETLRSMVMQASEKFRLEQELAVERMLFQGMMENVQVGLAFKDEQGRFLRLNQHAAHYLGQTIEECLGKTEEDFLTKSGAEKISRAYARLEKEWRTEETVQEIDPQTGQVSRWLHISRILLTSLAHHRFSLTIARDITEQKRMEARLRQAEKMQALGTMAGGIAHDFNNILAAIIGSLELMGSMEDLNDEKTKKILKNATKAALKGNGLTQRLLAFSRNKELSFEPVDINGMLEDLVPLIKQALEKRSQKKGENHNQVRLSTPTLSSSLPLVRTDKEQLEMAVMNLCFNAADAIVHDGTISLDLKVVDVRNALDMGVEDGQYVCLSVRDTGEGMPEETLAHIFEPFFTTKKLGYGTGLGLPMVYGFMQQQQGGIRVRSTVGYGTTVELYLPLAEQDQSVSI